MTDEEKAEEYVEGKAHEHYHFLFEENAGSPRDFAKLCYLDGLAEGKPKWHDLRKDPNDLPCFITPQVSLICNRQDFDEPKNVKYIGLGYQSCDTCKHSEVCENKAGFQNIENMLRENETYFELRCPFL